MSLRACLPFSSDRSHEHDQRDQGVEDAARTRRPGCVEVGSSSRLRRRRRPRPCRIVRIFRVRLDRRFTIFAALSLQNGVDPFDFTSHAPRPVRRSLGADAAVAAAWRRSPPDAAQPEIRSPPTSTRSSPSGPATDEVKTP